MGGKLPFPEREGAVGGLRSSPATANAISAGTFGRAGDGESTRTAFGATCHSHVPLQLRDVFVQASAD